MMPFYHFKYILKTLPAKINLLSMNRKISASLSYPTIYFTNYRFIIDIRNVLVQEESIPVPGTLPFLSIHPHMMADVIRKGALMVEGVEHSQLQGSQTCLEVYSHQVCFLSQDWTAL
jgi:hypothetical protein